MRAVGWIVVLLGGALAVMLAAPDRFGLTTTAPVTQLVAFRPVLGLASLALALLVLIVTSLATRWRRRAAADGVAGPSGRRSPDPSRPRFGATPAGAAVVVLLVTGGAHLGVTAARGLVNGVPLVGTAAGAGSADAGVLTVLSFNTLGGLATPAEVADAAERARADVLMLPETAPEVAAEIAAGLEARGRPMQVFTNDRGFSSPFSTSLLVSESLGDYVEVATRDGAGYVRADAVDGIGPPLVAVHPLAPASGFMDRWRRELSYAVDLCRQTPGAVVAGDFNATLDHGPMRDLDPCADAASALGLGGAGAHGTWHARLPSLLAAPIDHVLYDADAWRVQQVGVLEIGASDHRAVLARLVTG